MNATVNGAYPNGLSPLTAVVIGCAAGTPASAPAPAGSAAVAVALKEFSILPVPATITGSDVTFTVSNSGVVTHEMVLAKTDLDPAKLPTTKAGDPIAEGHAVGDVNEDAIDSPGEVDAVSAGGSKTGTFTLDPGQYVLFCNIPGHYAAGMRTSFTVVAPATPPPAKPTSTVDINEKEWSIAPVPATVTAGNTTLSVTNTGVHAHELILVKTDLDPAKLPTYTLVDADTAGQLVGDVNETSLSSAIQITTAPGSTKGETLQLTAGKYVLFCNLPGHYVAGMHVAFTVQ